jgi:hypothetical protein
MRPQKLGPFSPVTTSAAGLASAVAYSGNGYTLSATSAGDNLAHLITVGGLAATDHSAKTITVTGTDAENNALSENIAGPNGVATVTTTKYFKTVTSVTISATTGADTFNIGWNVGAVSQCLPLDIRCVPFSVGLMTDISGTINYTVQHTMQDILKTVAAVNATWIANAAPMSGATADQTSNYSTPVTGTRLLINSVTNGATIQYDVLQGLGN